MRKKNKRRLQGAVQNIIIVCLIVSAVFLFSRTGLIQPDTLNHFFSGVSQPSSSPQDQKINVQQPIHIAVRVGSECTGWLNETSSGEIFEDFGPLLTEALGSASTVTSVDETEFRRALENDSVYYDFTATLPLPLLEQWLGGSDESPLSSARALLLSSLQDNSAVLYSWNPDNDTFYRWNTTVPADSLLSAAEKHTGSALEFAFLSDAPYNNLAPYTLICQDRTTLYELSAKTVAQAECESEILTALEFNIHSNSRYPESNGTEVIVQGMRTLRFVPDGTVLYSGSEDGVPLLNVEHQDENATLAECTDAAWQMASTLLRNHLGDASMYLRSVSTDGNGNAEVLFGYMVVGYPVVFQDDYAVKIQIENNTITSFSLHLRSYTLTEKSSTLLPVLQAAAAAQDENAHELFCGYYDDGSDALLPCWLRR